MLSNDNLTFMNELEFTDLINQYCKEFSNWSRYQGVPKYDVGLAYFINKSNYTLHLRIDFTGFDSEVFIPLHYFSDTGLHRFYFPAFERNLKTLEIKDLSPERFVELVLKGLEKDVVDAKPDSGLLSDQWLKYTTSRQKRTTDTETTPSASVHLKELENDSSLLGKLSLIVLIISDAARKQCIDPERAASKWFSMYLDIVLPVLLSKQMHLYSLILMLDDNGNPLELRNIQSERSVSSSEKPDVFDEWIDSILFNHLTKLIGLIGGWGLCPEKHLLKQVYHHLKSAETDDETGFTTKILNQRSFTIQGKLLNIAYQRRIPNVLHEAFISDVLIFPKETPVFKRSFPAEQIEISIRPFDLERDLEMVHTWFHQDHAKAIWKMDWPLKELELFYRTMIPEALAQSYIGEINGEPTFNFEVYRANRDVVGDYFDVLPTDYGTHVFIAPTDKHKKYPSQTMQSIMDWLFAQPEVGRLVGEGAVESIAALMNKLHIGFRLQGVIEMPHKKANLNFCYREWYWEKFPQNRPLPEYETENLITK